MVTVSFLTGSLLAYVLVFARLGTMVMLLPAFGDRAIPPRVRLALALAFTVIMTPLVAGYYGALAPGLGALVVALISEILIGFFVGSLARLVMSVLHVAGTVIAFQTGLAFAQNVDPEQGVQSALVATFLSTLAVVMIFATELHYLLIGAMHQSYTLFAPGEPWPVGDFAEAAVSTFAQAFLVGVQLSAPFIVFGMVFYAGIGVLSRLIPQVQIFFIAMPANILIGLALLMLLIGALMTWFLDFAETSWRLLAL